MGCVCWGPTWWMQRFFSSSLERVSGLNYLWSITWIISMATLIAGVRGRDITWIFYLLNRPTSNAFFFFNAHRIHTSANNGWCTWSPALFIMSHESKQTEMATDKNFIACRYCSQTQRNSVDEAQTFVFIGRMAWLFKMGDIFHP